MRKPLTALAILLGAALSSAAPLAAQKSPDQEWMTPDPELDAEVEQCRHTAGVYFLDSGTLCFNTAIFPSQFLQLADLPEAPRTIITSPGGHVVTAQGVSRIFDARDSQYVIAGPCMSACPMVLLPGLDNVYIHRTASLAVHGATHQDYRQWFAWTHDDREPSMMDIFRANAGLDLEWGMYAAFWLLDRHLDGQDVSRDYATEIAGQMMEDLSDESCRDGLGNYWGVLDAAYLERHLGDRITGMEDFIQSPRDPRHYWDPFVTVVGERTFVFDDTYKEAGCVSTGAEPDDTDALPETDPETGMAGEEDGEAVSRWQQMLNEIRG